MKQLEKLILIASVFMLLGIVFQLGSKSVTQWLTSWTDLDFQTALQVETALSGVVKLLVPACIAVWLFRLAHRDGHAPWVWALLALVYQFLAPALYFALQIHRHLSRPASPESPT